MLKANLVSSFEDRFPLDINLQSPLYNQYLDCDELRKKKMENYEYLQFEALLDFIYESENSS